MPTTLTDRARRIALAVLFFCAAASQVTYTIDLAALLGGRYPARPFDLGAPWPAVRWAAPVAKAGELAPGDRVTAIDGKPVNGLADLAEIVHEKRPGDVITVAAARGNVSSDHAIRIAAEAQRPYAAYAIGAGVVVPVLCLLLGFWVAAVRIRDFRAWLLLGILLGMTQLTRAGAIDSLGWGAPLGVIASLLRAVGPATWAISMMLFGVYFPQRWSVDVKLPWAKWVLLAPAVAFGAEVGANVVAEALNYPSAAALPQGLLTDSAAFLTLCPCISVFFASIFQKYGEAKQADDRRRLRLLYWGASVAMTPMFLLFIGSVVFYHVGPGSRQGWLLTVATGMMMLFPLTLAYVVVVDRAMDVRMVVRQGVQYALATRGARVLQAAVVVIVIVLAMTLSDATGASRAQRLSYIAIGVVIALRIREIGDRLRRWIDRRFFREAYDADRILGELSEQVRGILNRDSLLETVARQLSQSLHVERIAVLLRDGAVFRPALATGYPAGFELTLPDDSRDPAPALGAELVLPLAGRKEVLGFVALGPKKSQEPYSPTDKALLRTVATQTGLALENAQLSDAVAHEIAQRELLNREIEIAREVQQRLFPQTLPPTDGLEYAGYCRPARGVGGDYYDFLALPGGRLVIAIGDVSGKGVPAALLMASLQASVRGQSQSGAQIAELMTNVNRLVCDVTPANRYATFFYAQFEPATRRLLYSNGGHNNPAIVRGGEVLRLEEGGPPVGLFPFSRYSQAEVLLEPGDLLVFFTDGVSEAENPAEEEWGEDALIAAARSCGAAPPAAMIEQLMAEADRFAAGAPQHDDMTLVVARVR